MMPAALNHSIDLAARIEQVRQSQLFSGEALPPDVAKSSTLLPARHVNHDFFLADLFDFAMKDDGVSMELPLFTLSTKPDLSPWSWQSADGKRCIEVYPSIKGRATQFDKDVLIYVISQMTEALNRKRDDARKRTVRFVVYDYLVSTNRPTGGQEYQRLRLALERLAGTRITTDIRTGGKSGSSGFGIIDQWRIARKTPDDKRMIAVEVTLSEWLFNAVQAHEVLTINRDYFRLRKPLERRIYELARKHCGHQRSWPIGLELLREKCGANSNPREFRRQLVVIIKSHVLPEYLISYDRDKDQVTFFNKKVGRL